MYQSKEKYMDLTVNKPADLWKELGLQFITASQAKGCMTYNFNNRFIIRKWKVNECQKDMAIIMRCLGYSPGGTKMTHLRKSYLIEDKFKILKEKVKEYQNKGRYTLGMNFNAQAERRGGCLLGFTIIRHSKKTWISIHMKVFEFPKKFAADILFFNQLIRELGLNNVEVYINSAAFFYWMLPSVGLKMLFGEKRITNPDILRSGFYKGKYEYRGVASLVETMEVLKKEYGEKALKEGLLYGC